MSSTTYDVAGTYLWTLPTNIDLTVPLTVELKGAGGGGPNQGGGTGGAGGRVLGTISLTGLTPGVSQFQINVGGKGGLRSSNNGGAGGFNGGAAGGTGGGGTGRGGYGGGGASDIRNGAFGLAQRLGVAAGGGGAASDGSNNGGQGGAATGQSGASSSGGSVPPTGGTSSAGGTAGSGSSNGSAGTSGNGGKGGNAAISGCQGGGGGGGGLFGGGGGAGFASPTGSGPTGLAGSGAGGSNYVGGLTSSSVNARGTGSPAVTDGVVVLTYNLKPNGPVMGAGGNFDVAAALPVPFTHNDPEAGDVMSKADLQWRVGSGAWNTLSNLSVGGGQLTGSNPSYVYTFGASTFSAFVGQPVEIQVRTYDAQNAQGAWSDSVFYTPRNAPATPTVATDTGTIASKTPNAKVTFPASTVKYQIRVVNDVAGAPGSTVYVDTGTISAVYGAGTTQSIGLATFNYVNGTNYHIQARYQHDTNVWSAWGDSGALLASINAPLQPTMALTPVPESGSVIVAVTNPGGDPNAPVHNDIYRTDLSDPDADEIRIATGVSVNGSYTDFRVGFNRSYRYRAVAVTATNAQTFSA